MLAMLLAAGTPLWGQTATIEPSGPSAASTPVAVHPRVEAIVSMRDKPIVSPAATPAHKQNYEFTLKDSDWLDTGVVLAAGEQVNFTVSGRFTLSDGRAVGPDGLDRGWMDLLRQFPLNQAKVGAVVARVSDMGASVPFPIEASGAVTMPTSGKLFLRVNVSNDLTGTGSFKVKVKFAPAAKVAAVAAPREAAVAVAEMVTPETFGDVPRRVSDKANDDGNEGDMVNFALVGTRGQVEAAYKAAGWVEQRNGKVTHKIDPEIDKERDFLLQCFDAAGVFSSAAYVTPADPMLKAVTATGGSFFSDGRIVVMALK